MFIAVAQNAILLFLPVKFNFCRIKSATKFLCVTTFSGKVVATSFSNLTAHRWIAGDVSALSAVLLTFSFQFSLLYFHVGSQAAAASYVV